MVDPVMRASGLRAVAAATVLAVGAGVLGSVLAITGSDVDVERFELLQTSLAFLGATISVLWIWGTIRASRGDDGAGTGLFALAATVASAALVLHAIVTLDPLLELEVAFGDDGVANLSAAARVCDIASQGALAIAVARLAWHARHGVAMFGATAALALSLPMLVFDSAASLDGAHASAVAWWLAVLPPVLVGTGIVTAVWSLPVPTPSVWRAFGRSLELIRIALGGLVVVAAAFMAALAFTDADTRWLRVALTGPVALLGLAAAIGAVRTSRRSIRWTRWSFAGTALLTVTVIVIEVVVGALIPFGIVALAPHALVLVEDVGVVLAVVALALLELGCARVDPALRRPALAAGVFLGVAVSAAITAIGLRHQPVVQELGPVIVGVLVVLLLHAVVMAVRLLGKGVAIAEARAYGERIRSAEAAKSHARLVHERWRAARQR